MLFCFAELYEVLEKFNQGPSIPQQQQRVADTTDTSGEDTDVEQPRRRLRSRRTIKMKKGYAVGELAQFFVTGPTDAANKLSDFYCRVYRKDVSVLTHGGYAIFRHFPGHRHFARDQRLRLETPVWRVLDFDGNPLPEDELERQRQKILLAPLVVRDREYPFREDLIPDALGNVDPQLLMLAKVSCLIDALQFGESYELVEKLWERFVLRASRINVTVAWSRDEVLVSSVLSPDSSWTNCFQLGFFDLFLFQSILLNGMLPRILTRVVDRVRAHRLFSVEFSPHGSATWAYIRTWKAVEIVRVAVAIIDRYYGDANSELAILGKILSAVGSGASAFSLSGGSHTLVECYKEYLESGYRKTLVD